MPSGDTGFSPCLRSSRTDRPSTSTCCRVPMNRRLPARLTAAWASSSAWLRFFLTVSGTSSSCRSKAFVPGRGLYLKMKLLLKSAVRTRSSVVWNSASVSPQKPTMKSLVTDACGIASRRRPSISMYSPIE